MKQHLLCNRRVVDYFIGFLVLLLSFTTTACSSSKTSVVKIPSIFQHLDNLKLVNKDDYLTSQKNFLTYDSLRRGYHDNYMFRTNVDSRIICNLGKNQETEKVVSCGGMMPASDKSMNKKVYQGVNFNINEPPKSKLFDPDKDVYYYMYGLVGKLSPVLSKPKILPIGYKIMIPFYDASGYDDFQDSKEDKEWFKNYNSETTCFVKDQYNQGCIVNNRAKTIAHGFWIDTKGTHTF